MPPNGRTPPSCILLEVLDPLPNLLGYFTKKWQKHTAVNYSQPYDQNRSQCIQGESKNVAPGAFWRFLKNGSEFKHKILTH